MPLTPPPADQHPFDALAQVLADLRAPDGCPWDREQTLQTLKPYALEEVYEVLEAIDGGDPVAHREELGDLLLQVVYQAQIRREEGAFDVWDVCRGITDKMVRRHPHVYGEAATDRAGHRQRWAELKAQEKPRTSALDGVPRALPALLRAQRLGEKASLAGFDWKDAAAVLPKVAEEAAELLAEPDRAHEELGDLLFSLVNLARHLGVDAESALQGANARFAARFRRVEALAAPDGTRAASGDDLERWWTQAKAEGVGG